MRSNYAASVWVQRDIERVVKTLQVSNRVTALRKYKIFVNNA